MMACGFTMLLPQVERCLLPCNWRNPFPFGTAKFPSFSASTRISVEWCGNLTWQLLGPAISSQPQVMGAGSALIVCL